MMAKAATGSARFITPTNCVYRNASIAVERARADQS
jgi:hypothetical protein